MADVIDYKVFGGDMQLVEIELDPREGVRAEAGAMTYMEDGIEMETGTKGGFMKGLKRMVTGESFFITTFYNQGSNISRVGFGAPYPGKIVPIDLQQYNGRFICQKDSFLCAANGVEIEIELTKKLGAGFFGGEGFILQRLEGNGLAFIHAGGTIIEKDLKHGEKLRVDTGCIVGFESTVGYDIQFVGGFKNALFGKEGLFLAHLSGPGKVYLQSLPISRLAERMYASASMGSNQGESNTLDVGGAILGGLFGDK